MIDLQTICNMIVLIGGVFVAIKTIANSLGKPIKFFKKRSDKLDDEKFQKMAHQVTAEVVEQLEPKFNEIFSQNTTQTLAINRLNCSTCDMLREHIIQLYERRRNVKQLTVMESEILDRRYRDYYASGGNGHIKKIYEIMSKWDVVDNEKLGEKELD